MENSEIALVQDETNMENSEIALVQDETIQGNLLARLPSGEIDWNFYGVVIIAFSGGKDSLACLLHVLEMGCPKSKIELWHHDIDGQGIGFMDWKCTPSYCKAVADALGVAIYFSWKVGGFEKEMMRNNEPTAAISFQTPCGSIVTVGGDSLKRGTRLLFPQMSPYLSVRWCSAYLKIDVAARAITNQDRFKNSNTLFITGERAEESAGRARYAKEEAHRTDCRGPKTKRRVDQWRPVHSWSTMEVWNIIKKWKIKAHPCYRLGWGRCSCAACIFGSKDQWASLQKINAPLFNKVAAYETQFGKTIDRKLTVKEKALLGKPYLATSNLSVVLESNDAEWANHNSVIEDVWTEPAGMYAEIAGPC